MTRGMMVMGLKTGGRTRSSFMCFRYFLVGAAMLMAAVGLGSQTETVDGVTYTYDVGSGATITKIQNSGSQLIIPSRLGGYQVTVIKDMSSISKLTCLVIPSGVVRIDSGAFYGCKNLKYLSLPSTLQIIDSTAFYQCKALEEVFIPDSVTTIGGNAFSGCASLYGVRTPISFLDEMSQVYPIFGSCPEIKKIVIHETPYGNLPRGLFGSDNYSSTANTTISDIYITSHDAPRKSSYLDYSSSVITYHAPWSGYSSGSYYKFSFWNPSYYTTYFNANGGSVDPSSVSYPAGIPYGALPTPWQKGYVFDGWYTSSSGYERVDGRSTVPWSNRTLYARWKKVEHQVTITFDANGGSGTMATQTIAAGGSANLTANRFTRSDGTFAGWSLEKSGSVDFADKEYVSSSDFESESVTLYARWSKYYQSGSYKWYYDGSTFTGIEPKPSGSISVPEVYLGCGAYVYRLKHSGSSSPGIDFSGVTSFTLPSVLTYVDIWDFTPSRWWANQNDTIARIGEWAIGLKRPVTSLVIPSGIKKIAVGFACGEDDSYGSLQNLTLPDGLTHICPWAFCFQPELSNVKIPASVKSIGEAAFDCAKGPFYFLGDRPYVEPYEDHDDYGLMKVFGDGVIVYFKSGMKEWEDGGYWFGAITRKWPTFKVTFNANGGSVSPTERYVESDSAVGPLPTPERIGYTFAGWYTAASGGTPISSDTIVTGNVTCYAHWAVKTYKVIFDPTGGSVSPTSKTVESGSAVGTLPDEPTKTGHTFNGWYTSDGQRISSNTIVTGDVTYYAHWTVNRYTATFDANGGSGGTSKTQDYGSSLTAPSVTRTGYTLTGWSPSVPSTMPAANNTYTAQWSINFYTATFDANGGVGGTTKTQAYDTNLSAPTVSREGHTFTGWSPSVPAKMPAYNSRYVAQWSVNSYTATFDANGGVGGTSKTQNYGTSLTAPSVTRIGYTLTGWSPSVPSTMPAANNTYIAQWKLNTYTVIFDANGGVASPSSFRRDHNSELGTLPSASRGSAGSYKFLGWFTDRTGGGPVSPSDKVLGDVTYYAHWNQIAPDLTIRDGELTKVDLGQFRNVVIPDSVTRIARGAFDGCDEAIFDKTSIPGVKLVDGWAIGSTTSLSGKLELANVRGVADYAFQNCSGITSLVVPNGVKRIGAYAFNNCGSLASVTLLPRTINLGSYAFADCKALKNVYASGELKGTFEKSVFPTAAKIAYGTVVQVYAEEGQEGMGSVSGYGAYQPGKNAALKATPGKGHVFVGWYDGGRGAVALPGDDVAYLSKSPSYSYPVPNAHAVIVARFAKGSDDAASLKVNVADVTTEKDGAILLDLGACVESLSLPKLAVSGLPSGVKYDAKTMRISGKATKPGVYVVKVTATNATVTGKDAEVKEFKISVPNLTTDMFELAGLTTSEVYILQAGVPPALADVFAAIARGGWKLAVSGLPAGVKYDAKKNALEGIATKPGFSTVYFTATRGKEKQVATATFEVVFPKLTLQAAALSGGNAGGTVTGDGMYPAGKKVTLKATPREGHVFAGWYNGETLLSQEANLAYVTTDEDATLTAVFATEAEDAASVIATLNGSNLSSASIATNVMCGVSLNWQLAVEALSQPTVAVAGLPSGLKFTAKDIVDSKTKQVTIPANTIYGIPTAASKMDKKTGAVTPSVVKVTVTTAGKTKVVHEIDVTVAPLPAWAAGTFDGASFDVDGNAEGLVASLTIAANGKISGKLIDSAGTWTLSAASYSAVENPSLNVDDSVFHATVIAQCGKLVSTNDVTVASEEVSTVGAGQSPCLRGVASCDRWTAWQNLWKTEPWKTMAKPFANKTLNMESEVGTVAFKFAASGAVTASGGFVTGYNPKTRKDVVYSASCSAVLVPVADTLDAHHYQAFLYFPPKTGKFDGYASVVYLHWNGMNFEYELEPPPTIAKFTVTFDANGGSLGTEDSTREVEDGKTVGALPAAMREGYTLAGWFSAAEGGEQVTAETIVTGDITYYAHWTVNRYTATFEWGSGRITTTQDYGTIINEPPSVTRTGYTFAGWSPTVPFTMPATNSTYVAQWRANSYTVTFNANGGSVSPTSKSVTYDDEYGELPTPEWVGYTFDGWYKSASGGEQIVSTTKVSITSALTLYAHWLADIYIVPARYKVELDLNGGSIDSTPLAWEVIQNSPIPPTMGTLPNTATREGYTFAGWWTAAEGGEEMFETTAVTNNVTCYAHWTANTYTVTFNANGGSVSPTSKTVTYDDVYGDLPSPEWSGHTFDGWFTGPSSGEQVTASTIVKITADQTLYAHWTEDTQPDEPITWYVNGTTGNDSNDGTSESSAKATIQAAIDEAIGGDTILVAPGTYAPISTENKAITIRGTKGAASTIIDAKGTSQRCVTGRHEEGYDGRRDICTNTVIIGFTLQNGEACLPLVYSGQGGGCADGGTYRNCVLLNGVGAGGGNAGGAVLENCLIKGGTAYNGGNVIGSIVRNCTIVSGNALHSGSAYYNCAVYNSICVGTSLMIGSWDWGALVDTVNGAQENVFTGDPGFVDAANGDYRLAADSPCIDAGDNSYVAGETDLDGNPRIVNGTVDIGCYEYSSAVSNLYMVIDLSGGPTATSYQVSYLSAIPDGGWTDEYKTTKLVMRRIPAGSFMMGDGKDSNLQEVTGNVKGSVPVHSVVLTKDFYIGVFQVTQRQWELVMGSNPSYFSGYSDSSRRPVETVSYNMIRGETLGAEWPQNSNVDDGSFLSVIRAKTRLDNLDLPTSAQWEYACRAGTSTDLNTGVNLTGSSTDSKLDGVGWYSGNSSGSTHEVGLCVANNWGLYDMHGNVWEWCLDWYDWATGEPVVDPVGPATQRNWGDASRVFRGGAYNNSSGECRSANEADYGCYRVSHLRGDFGFRLAMTVSDGSSIVPPTTIYTVTFDTNGGSLGTASPTREVEDGATIGPLPVAMREGYTLAGWYTAANGGEQVTVETIVTADITYYAHWTVNHYTATFDANGGSGGTTKTQDYGTSLSAPSVTRTGYAPAGWQPTVPSMMPASNATYVAQWRANSYVVMFDANGGSVSPTSKSVTYDDVYGDLPTPEWSGHTFDGWFTSLSSGEQVTANSTVKITTGQTLYAHWTEDTQPDEPITWYVNGTTGNDSNDGTSESSAKATIQAAIDTAIDGDTILVAPGTYAPIATENKMITICGTAGAANTYIDGMGISRCVTVLPEAHVYGNVIAYTNTCLYGFTLQNGVANEPNAFGGGAYCGTYYYCVFNNNRGGGGGGCYGAVLHSCLLIGNYAINGGATESCACYNCAITGNSVRDSGAAGWDSAFVNCIIYGNDGWSIFYYRRDDGIGAPAHDVSYCKINCYENDPIFVDAANGDYRLASDSPCIDTGDNSYVAGETDLDGNARIMNGTVDIGCYEYGLVVSNLYMVIDMSGGPTATSYPVSYLSAVPDGGWTDEYKTTKLVLRLIEPGTFMMDGQYEVTLTKPFYCGVFEVTQKQYELVMGNNPSSYRGDMRPVEKVAWDTIRGNSSTYDWPGSTDVDPDSFMGRIQARAGLRFDLPTEAQWEYSCRAGVTSAYNDGGDTEDDLKQLGRYAGNNSDGKGGYSDRHTTVGSYLPNAWGLCDMHGNVWEWCLDWRGNHTGDVTDPVGPVSGEQRILRGGGWNNDANSCASYSLGYSVPSHGADHYGFRLVRTLSEQTTSPSFTIVDGVLTAVQLNGATDVVIPNGVKSIEGSVFYHCSDLASVTMPNGVTNIGIFAFAGCSGLKSVTIPNGVVNIDEHAFVDCSGLTSVTIPNSVKEIGSGAFAKCSSLTSVTIPNSVVRIRYGAFSGCGGLKSVTIQNDATIIEECAFSGCSGLADDNGFIIIRYVLQGYVGTDGSVTIPSDVARIGDLAFCDCSCLTSVTIPNSVTSIGYGAFANCSSLTSVTIPSSVNSIESYAFEGSGLTDVHVAADEVSRIRQLIGDSGFTGNLNFITSQDPQPTATATFDPNGGSVNESSRSIAIGSAIGTLPGATREGCAFVGWYTAANGGEQVTAETIVTGDITCYAHWTEDETEPDNHGKVQLWAGGLYWAETNIGAEKPEDCGYYFWWGDTVGCERVNGVWVATDRSSNFSFSEANTPTSNKSIATLKDEGWITEDEVLAPEHDAAHVQWGGSWRMPTKQDLDDLKNNCNFTWTTVNGVKGYIVSGKGDYSSNSIFLPCAGYGTGTSHKNVSYGYYLSSVPCSDDDSYSWHFNFGPSYRNTYRDDRSPGSPVRPVQGFSESPHPVTITFNANGGSVSPETRTVTSVSEVGRLPIPRRSGWSFAGWFTAVDGGSPIGENMVASSDVTYYAHWTSDGGLDSIFTEQVNGYMWTYRIAGSTAEIYGIDGSVAIWPKPVGAVEIPSTLGGYSVTRIGESAFSDCRSMTNVTIPDCVTDIGYSAFENCDQLSNVVIPDYVTSIGDFAFDDCESLASVTIPDSVISLGQGVFRGCYGLKNAVLGSGVANIGDYAFSGCYELANVTIATSVTNIGLEAFSGCQSLMGAEIPDSVVSIGESAFSGCSGLTSVTIPYGVATIGNYAFYECSGLTIVAISGSVSHIGDCLFCKCESLAEVTIGDGVESIGCQAFSNCIGLESVTLPDSMIDIADYAFEYCSTLRSVSLPGTLMDRVNPEAFYESPNVVITYRDEDTDPHGKVQLWAGGPYWAKTNIGAEKPEDYGYYFWWGDTIGYRRLNVPWSASDGSSSDFLFIEDNTPTYLKDVASLQSDGWITANRVLSPEHDAAHVHWGGSWRIPTQQELSDLGSKCSWEWTTRNGVQGYLIRGTGDYASASIFLPATGVGDGPYLNNTGWSGNYWSSVPYWDYEYYSWGLFFNSSNHNTRDCRRFFGLSIRPVQEFTE